MPLEICRRKQISIALCFLAQTSTGLRLYRAWTSVTSAERSKFELTKQKWYHVERDLKRGCKGVTFSLGGAKNKPQVGLCTCLKNKDHGEMTEWLKVLVSKTSVRETVPGVRISLSPQKEVNTVES
jgi:hypothetical protein